MDSSSQLGKPNVYPFKRWRDSQGLYRANHDDIMKGMRELAKGKGWSRKPGDGGWDGT